MTELPEIAFVGRSNAGKSTAINVLTQQKRLAFASKTPGRTQHINLFELGPKLAADALFADLPGYGYAAVERNAKLRWQEVMADYLAVRRSLERDRHAASTRASASPSIDRKLLDFVVTARGQRLGQAARAADQGRQAEPARARAGGRRRPRVVEAAATDETDFAVATLSALSRVGVAEVARSWTICTRRSRRRERRRASCAARGRLQPPSCPVGLAAGMSHLKVPTLSSLPGSWVDALLPVLDLDGLEDHLDLLQDVAFLGGRSGSPW